MDRMSRSIDASLSHYPSVLGIYFALKSDALVDKKIALALKEKNEWKALRIALSTTARRHQYIALLLYLSKKYFNWVPSLAWTLKCCALLGPARHWFEYLQQSSTRPSLVTATTLLQSLNTPQTILDIGTGMGHLPFQFAQRKGIRWVGVDKNFFSLFLAQLYHGRSDITYLCADIEVQHLFPAESFTTAVCIDCFDFIFQKDAFLADVAHLLKTNGQFFMLNLHEEQAGTELWGYGMSYRELLSSLRTHFRSHTWHDMNDPYHSYRSSFRQLDSMRYSFVAKK